MTCAAFDSREGVAGAPSNRRSERRWDGNRAVILTPGWSLRSTPIANVRVLRARARSADAQTPRATQIAHADRPRLSRLLQVAAEDLSSCSSTWASLLRRVRASFSVTVPPYTPAACRSGRSLIAAPTPSCGWCARTAPRHALVRALPQTVPREDVRQRSISTSMPSALRSPERVILIRTESEVPSPK